MAENKVHKVTVALTPYQRQEWEKIAQKEDRNLADFIRHSTGVYIAMLKLKQEKASQN